MSVPGSMSNLNQLAQDILDVSSQYQALVDQISVLSTQNQLLNGTNQDLNSQIASLNKQITNLLVYKPTVNPAVSLKNLGCRTHAHIVCWFGQSNHADVGYNSQSDATIAWQMDQLVAKGISGVNVLFSGRTQAFNTLAAQKLLAAAASRGLILSIMIDHEATVSADDFRWAIDNLAIGDNYWRWNGKRVITVFDAPTDAQLAVTPSDVALIYRNSGGLSKTNSSGCFGWPSPGSEDAYCTYFYKQTNGVSGKLIIPHVSPGFLGASWNQTSANFKPTPWLNGQEWINSINRVLNSGSKPTDVMIATWNDHEEGTGIERSPLL